MVPTERRSLASAEATVDVVKGDGEVTDVLVLTGLVAVAHLDDGGGAEGGHEHRYK